MAINQDAVFAPISCAGKPTQTGSCALWRCPDCSRNCSTGTLNAACDACICDHHVLTGRVLTVNDAPLSEANISLAETPYNILAQTNISGHFVALNVCANTQELLVTKAGFVPTRKKANVLTQTTATMTAKLELAVPPSVTIQPKSKIRMAGQSVTFCCDGEGNPPPEIEWFKENNVIDKDLHNYNNTLEISDVTGLNGSFRCRVINQFGSEFSKVAELKVFARSVDSCSSAPISKNQTLPPGCVLNGTNITVLDVGECERVACVKGNDTFESSCSDFLQCCGPRSFDNFLVKCGPIISFTLPKIKNCGCGECIDEKTILHGRAVGRESEAARFVDLFFNGKQVYRTDVNGVFSFSVPRDTKRAIVTFKDEDKKFQEEDKTFILNEGQKAMYKVTLREKPQPVIFNASEPLDLPLGGDSDSFADLELPENTLLTEDGSVFQGNAKASLSVIDPRNLSDILTAPGDFTTVSEDGEEEILETYGMIKLNVEDDNGKPLVMSKPMKVYLDPEKLNLTVSEGNASAKLYWLERKTGRWREAGDFSLEDGSKRRRKRTNRVFLVGTVTPSIAQEFLNFDWPEMRVGVRVTVSSAEDNVIITAIRKDNKGYVQRITNQGVVCMAIWKDKDYYLQAEKDSKYYDPDQGIKDYIKHVQGDIESTEGYGDTIGSFKFHSALVNQIGPIYYDDSWIVGSEMQMCEKSLNDPERPGQGGQFVFKPHKDANQEYALLQKPDNRKKWISYTRGEICFIKVKIAGSNALFMATSYDADAQTVIGFHIRMSKNVTTGSGSVTCLQFRCPPKGSRTAVLVTPMASSITCQYNKTAQALNAVQANQKLCPTGSLPTAAGQEKWLCIPFSKEKYSTFSGYPKERGEARCLRDKQYYSGQDLSEISSDGASVEYTCS